MEAVKCEAFLAAAELGSLTATAELLGYTQSGVTRMIGTLEEELGFPLFLRSKKGVQLTENGKLMLPLLREVVRAHHNAEQLSAEIGGVSKGSLTIGCYYSISALWMPEILTAFRARYPGVTVRMQEGGNLEMARWLNERSVDCCFGAQMHGDKYDWLPVFRDELVAWLPRGHELAEADAFPLMRLQDEPFIHTSPNHDTDQDRLLEQHGLHPQLSAEIGGVSKGSLTIGCYYSISALWMPEILTAFRARYPGVTVRMQEGGNLEMARWLNERSVDCCFGAQMHGDKYDWLPVFRDELVAWLPRGHELAEADAFPLMRLQDEPFIHTSPNHDTDQDRLLEQHGLHPQTCFTTRDGFTTYNMVEAGLGVSFNQRLISRKWSGTVAEVPFDPPQFVTLGISVPSLREASPAAKKFIACAIETVTGGEKSL